MTDIGKSKIQVLIKVGYNLPDLKFSDLNSHVFFLTSGALTIVSNLKSYHERLSVHLDCCKPVKSFSISTLLRRIKFRLFQNNVTKIETLTLSSDDDKRFKLYPLLEVVCSDRA